MSDVESENRDHQGVVLPIKWHVSKEIHNQYVHNLIVQPGAHEITLFFFETQIPPFAGSPEENKEFLLQEGFVTFECVSKITVAPDVLPEFIKALQTGLDNYNVIKKQTKKESQEDE